MSVNRTGNIENELIDRDETRAKQHVDSESLETVSDAAAASAGKQEKQADEELSEVDLKEGNVRREPTSLDEAKGEKNKVKYGPEQTESKDLRNDSQIEVATLDEKTSTNKLVASSLANVIGTPSDERDFTFKRKCGLIRHLIAVLALSSIVLANMNRQAFNQALVSMTKTRHASTIETIPIRNVTQEPFIFSSTITQDFETSATTQSNDVIVVSTENSESIKDLGDQIFPHESSEAQVEVDEEEEDESQRDRFDWTGAQISTLQSAFAFGYTPFMIPGGRMSELYGAKWVVFLSGFGSALCCIFSPYFADTNYNLLVASRVFMGLCQTGVSPALYALLTRWLPPDESCVYLPMIKVGVMVGFMCGSLVSGFFTWRYTFYITGVIGLMWSVLWILSVTSDPRDHKLLSKKELDYIKYELRRVNKGSKNTESSSDQIDEVNDKQTKKKKTSAPWIRILTNPVVVAFMFAKFTNKLSTDAQSMQIPMYLKNVFKVPQELNGMLSASNFAIQGIFTGLVAYTAREFVVRGSFGLNKTGVRRLFQGISNFGMAAAYILVTFNMSSLSVVCCAFMLLSITSMFGAGGEAVTPVDLSTEYSASIMAIANSCANLSGIILPPIISAILDNQFDSADNWNLAWRILAGIIILGGLTYTFFVTAELQDFDRVVKKKTDSDSQTVVVEMRDTSLSL